MRSLLRCGRTGDQSSVPARPTSCGPRHCAGSTAAATPPRERWTSPAFTRYAKDVVLERRADVVVRVDNPCHPALLLER